MHSREVDRQSRTGLILSIAKFNFCPAILNLVFTCPAISYLAFLCPANLCPVISCPAIWSVIFMSCNFTPCNLVRQFHVLQIHVLQFWRSVIFMSVIFSQPILATLTTPVKSLQRPNRQAVTFAYLIYWWASCMNCKQECMQRGV